MADIQATLGLDRREFKEGLAAADREGAAWARGMERSFSGIEGGLKAMKLILAGGLVGHFFKEGVNAVREYGKYNDEAQRLTEKWDASMTGLAGSLGQLLMPVLEMVAGVLDHYTDGLGEAIIKQNQTAESMRKLQAETQRLAEIKKQAAIDDDRFRRDVAFSSERTLVGYLRLDGRDREAAVREATMAPRRQLADVEADQRLSPEQKVLRRGLLGMEIGRARDFAGRSFDAQQKRAHDQSVQEFTFEQEARAIRVMQAQGLGFDAGIRQLFLDARRSVMQVTADKSLSADEKARFSQMINDSANQEAMARSDAEVQAAQAALGLAGGRATFGTRTLASGLGSALAAQGAFGTGTSFAAPADRMVKLQEKLVEVQKRNAALLEAIKDNTAQPVMAVAG